MVEASSRRAGATLLELLAVLCILGVLLGIGATSLVRARDRAAVAAARDEVAATLARARVTAVAAGGARVVVDVAGARVELRTAEGAAAPPLDLRASYGVAVVADGRGERIELGFDGYGIGRLSSRTLRFRRGEAEGRLTISAYGRVRRW